jgi:hypothetical protein
MAPLRMLNAILTSNIEKNQNTTFQEAPLNKHFFIKVTTGRLLLAYPSAGRISAACNQRVSTYLIQYYLIL